MTINVRMQSPTNRLKPKITVVGVGGAGGNAVNNMINSQLEGCEFLVCNTDAQALEGSSAGMSRAGWVPVQILKSAALQQKKASTRF